jgi:hypothetical protein
MTFRQWPPGAARMASIGRNAFRYAHLFLAPATIGPGVVVFLLEIYLVRFHWFSGILLDLTSVRVQAQSWPLFRTPGILGRYAGIEERRSMSRGSQPGVLRLINERCLRRNKDGHCVVVVSGMVLAQYASNDPMVEAHGMVSLVEQGWADQIEIARLWCSSTASRRTSTGRE